jgi:hypothetical protein
MPDFSLLDWAVALLIAQAILGALDTLYHHELTVALPYRRCCGSCANLRRYCLKSIWRGWGVRGCIAMVN